MNRLTLANKFVELYKKGVKTTYRPHFHIIPPVGWANDPNGFSYFKGEYHLFYQYHPYFSKWGPMHWAHIKSKDLIKWEWCPIALAPDEAYEFDGCFSGTAIEANGEHVLMYTSHLHPNPDDISYYIQQQCIAKSEDGINYTKSKSNPVIKTKDIPKDGNKKDFRDPKIWKEDDIYYCIIASKNIDGSGQLLLYESYDMENWKYKSILCKSNNNIGEMWECPDLFTIDGYDMLMFSSLFLKEREYEFTNIYSSIYAIGNFDIDKGKFNIDKYHEIDLGLDFYAPQTVLTPDGRRVMIAWLQTWERNYPTNDMKHNWACTFTLPREIHVVNGKLLQKPVDEIKKYRKNKVSYTDIEFDGEKIFDDINGDSIELFIDVDLKLSEYFEVDLFVSKDEDVKISYDVNKKIFTFDRRNIKNSISGLEEHDVNVRSIPIELINNKINIQLFIDVSTVEIFINNGEFTMSSTVFPKEQGKDIRFISRGKCKIKTLEKWNISLQ